MSHKVHLSHGDIQSLAAQVVPKIRHTLPGVQYLRAYGVPRGGVSAAMAVHAAALGSGVKIDLVSELQHADIVIDDIVDSGRTRELTLAKARWTLKAEHFFALIDKTSPTFKADKSWYVFPWEGNESASVSDVFTRLLQFIGEDVTRGGLQETPARAAKAWQEWCSGYTQDPADILKVFEDGAQDYDQMVTVRNIPIYSHCEHHLAPIIGTVDIGYIPNGKIVGLSKLSRLADIFSRRLQVQERLTCQIADALNDHLAPHGVGVVIKARHMCMESRGVRQQGHHTVTTALRGIMRNQPEARSEFLGGLT
jgi:GTP cyclohydrolase I